MQIGNHNEFKSTVSGLRAELKKAGITQFSHTQVQEMLAKAMGASSWGELKTKLPKARAKEAAPPAPEAFKPVRCLADLDPLNLCQLDNHDGWLDLVKHGEDGALVTGFFEELEGPLEDIVSCTASASGTHRKPSGEVHIQYDGETEVNWDGQETRKADNGRVLWCYEGETINESLCLMAPDGFDREEPEDAPVRKALVDIYERIVRENPKCGVQKVLEEGELPLPERNTLEWIARHLWFRLHESEAQALYERLRGQQQLL